jgi:hypothetical protein
MFFRFLFVHLSFFFWPLCCLSFNLRIRIIALVSSNRPSTDSMFATKFSRSIIIGQRFYWCSFIFYHCKILCNPKMLWVVTMMWLTARQCLCHKWPRISSTWRKHFPVLSSFMIINDLPEHLSSPPVFSGNRVTQTLALCVCFVYIWPKTLSVLTIGLGTLT